MAWHNPSIALRTYWQDQIEISLEAGETPLLDLGASTGVLESIPVLVALHVFAEQRADMAAPTIVSGGNSLLWLAALVQPHSQAPTRSPNLTVLYGGADLATQVASGMTQRVNQPARLVSPDALPASFAPLFAPGAHAGPLLWEALPFALAEEGTAVPQPGQAESVAPDPWLTWTAIIFVVVLVGIAFLV